MEMDVNPANISTSPEKFREYRFRDFPNKRLLANSVRVLLFLRRLKHILKKFTFDRFLNWKCHPIGIQSNFNVLRTLLITKESEDQKPPRKTGSNKRLAIDLSL